MSNIKVKNLHDVKVYDQEEMAEIVGGRYKSKAQVLPGKKFFLFERSNGDLGAIDITGLVTDIKGEDGDYTEEAAEAILKSPNGVIPLF